MKVINARNVHQAFPMALDYLFKHGEARSSRNGPVLAARGPVTTVYEEPRERVLFWPERDANPFFHFFESLWMLAGRRDVEFLTQFVKRMVNFSDDGVSFHGAYGYRWRGHFAVQQWFEEHEMADGDQLRLIADRLRTDHTDRRQVLTMWDPRCDLPGAQHEMKDLPCNTQVYFQRDLEGRLDMVVTCRSNDIVWGCYGANAVHFSMLQEYMAGRIGCPIGRYWQMSFNWHGYLNTVQPLEPLCDEVDSALMAGRCITDPYETGALGVGPLMLDLPAEQWDKELRLFLEQPSRTDLESRFLSNVARPLAGAHSCYQQLKGEQRFTEATALIAQCVADDWRLAARQWITRRHQRWQSKEQKRSSTDSAS